jgi:two-component system cell cycle sensor histidine kinase/response regulator CckA
MIGRATIGASVGAAGGTAASVDRVTRMIGRQFWLLMVLSLAFASLMLLAPDFATARTLGAIGATFSMLALLARTAQLWRDLRTGVEERDLRFLTEHDTCPCFTTDSAGRIGFRNTAARLQFGADDAGPLLAALQDHFASPVSVMYRLQARARAVGSAHEDLVSRHGIGRLGVRRIGAHRYLWRLENSARDDGGARGADGIGLPMLVANKAGAVLFANAATRRLLGERPRHIDAVLGPGPVSSGREVTITTPAGRQRVLVTELGGSGERREIYLLPSARTEVEHTSPTDFENVPVALLKFGADGQLLNANRAAREAIGLSAGQRPLFHELFEGLGRPVQDWLCDIAAERIPAGAEVLHLRGPEASVFFQIGLRRIIEAGGPAVLAVLNDATALKTLEAQFVQSQKMQAIGQLAGGIAHDFNNLLTAISGHCDLLLLRHDRTDSEYADLVQIHQNANRAASLVRQLLAFSRKQTLKPQRLDLQEVLSDLTHLLNRLVGEKVSLRLTHAIGLGAIRADRRQLEQVVMNLVVNARDAMREGGTIRIETEALTMTEDLRRDRASVPPGNYAVIRVIDAGCGIPPDRLPHIFEPFFTTKRVGEGTGLGLSTAYGIVKQSGGYIFVDSDVGRGTTFHLYFPISTDVASTEVPAPVVRSVAPRAPGGVVLLVEDEAPVRAFASRALRLRGFTVLEADCAESALTMLEDARLEVDVFVTDVVMPGQDGPGWVREALKRRPNVRTIFVSGYAEDHLSATQAGIPNSVFLPKPFSLTDLTEMVQRQLGGTQPDA